MRATGCPAAEEGDDRFELRTPVGQLVDLGAGGRRQLALAYDTRLLELADRLASTSQGSHRGRRRAGL